VQRRIARRPAFPPFKTAWMTSSGPGPRRLIAPRCRTFSALAFWPDKANCDLPGRVGLGKSHLASALGHAACLAGHSVLFTTAVEIITP